MKKYEGMFILKPDIAQEGLDKAAGAIEAAITKSGGKVENCAKWARRKLAYPVKKHVEGEYYLCNFEAEPNSIIDIEGIYRLNESILRVLITQKEQ